MGELPEDIWVRNCNMVNGTLPVNFEPSAIFKDTKYTRAPQWQPIETAPRDGADVLCFTGNVIILNCLTEKTGLMRPDGDPKQEYRGVWRAKDRRNSCSFNPSHWMPKPQPPEDTK